MTGDVPLLPTTPHASRREKHWGRERSSGGWEWVRNWLLQKSGSGGGFVFSRQKRGTGILASLYRSPTEINVAGSSASSSRLATESTPPPQHLELQPQDLAWSQTLLREGAEWGRRGRRTDPS